MQEMEVDSWAGTARSITVHAAQTVTDFADASHSESAKSITITVLYGIFSSENSYPMYSDQEVQNCRRQLLLNTRQ
ncbi:MAG: hypothetical protein ACLUAR_02000 [Pilosibacter sp.]